VAQLNRSLRQYEGGAIVLGVVNQGKGVLINGLSDEFRAVQITRKASTFSRRHPSSNTITSITQGKRLFVIEVPKVLPRLSCWEQELRQGRLSHGPHRSDAEKSIKKCRYRKSVCDFQGRAASPARPRERKLLDHYESVLLILTTSATPHPKASSVPTDNPEARC